MRLGLIAGGLLAVSVWLGPDVAAETALNTAARDALATRVYMVAHEIEASRSLASPLIGVAADVAELRQSVDVISASAKSDAAKHKVSGLSALIASLERAIVAPAATHSSLIPTRLPAARRFDAGIFDDARNASCETALAFGTEREIDATMSAGGEVWLRFDAPGPALYRVSTEVTPLDTEISVFAKCPATADTQPLAVSDDAFGLAATAPVDLRSTPGPRWLRVRNLGSAGSVAIIAGTAGTISGRITDIRTGNGIWDVDVSAYSAKDLSFGGNSFTDTDGNYGLLVAANDYYVYALAEGYVGEIWPNAPCPYQLGIYNCALGNAQTVTVAAGATVPGIDFGLTTGARIAGRATDRSSGAPVINAQVVVYDDQTGIAGSAITDAAGRYQVTGLLAGTFRVQVQGSSYLSQAYDNIDCQQFCDPSVGTPIMLADFESFDTADFALAPLVWITVTVNLVDGAQPFDLPLISIVAPDGTTAGPFPVFVGEPSSVGPVMPGSYYFYAGTNGYIPQIFDHVDCPADCASYLAHGTLVTVSPTGEPPELTFDLSPTPAVTGRVTDATTGAGLANVTLQLWSVTNGFVTRDALTGADGSYRIAGPDPGAYYVVARSSDHQDMAYPDAPCSDRETYSLSSCTLSNAEQITVEARGSDVTGVDLALPLNATIEGTVRFRVNSSAGGVLSDATIRVYDAAGIALTYSLTDADGHYVLGDLPPGTYYFEGSAVSYFSEIYSGIDCPLPGQECNPTSGTPIALTQGQTLDAIDFDLVGANSIVGRVIDARSGAGVSGVAIDSWDSSDDMHCGVTATDASGYYVVSDNVRFCEGPARKISTDAGTQYIDQVFDGIVCTGGPAYLGLCPLDNATLLAVPSTVPQPIEADFVLQRGDRIFSHGFE